MSLWRAGCGESRTSGPTPTPTCPQGCAVSGCTATWWWTSGFAYLAVGQRAGGTRSSPGTCRTEKTPSWPRD